MADGGVGLSPSVTQVALLGSDEIAAVNDDGTWEIRDIIPGEHTLEVRATGEYANTFKRQEVSVTVLGGQSVSVAPITLPLARGGVTGTVTLEGEGSYENVFVEIVETGAGATTNAAGEYAIASVPNGSYSMRFSKTGFNTAYEIGINVSTEQDTAVPPVQLTVLRGHLAGTVLLEDGSSPTVVQVSVLGTDRVSAVQEDGSWEINEVVPGNYVVELRATGEYAGQYRRHEQPVTGWRANGDVSTLTLPRAKGTLTGQVTSKTKPSSAAFWLKSSALACPP